MTKLKVSVLIANYNNQKYIKECIDSINRQTYKNIEIIFHDDFSSDNSIKSIIQYPNIKIIKTRKEENMDHIIKLMHIIELLRKVVEI